MRIRIILPSFVLPLCLLGLLFAVNPMHSGASSQGQDEVTAAQFAAALEAQKQADAKLTRGESAEQRFQELSAKLQRRGAVRVIVQLRVAFRPEGEMRQSAERLAQRASIKQEQDELLNGFHLRNPRSLKRFKYLPYLAFSVDAAGLEALRSAPEVIDIYDDGFMRVAQAQSPSISLIGAPNAWASGYTGAEQTIAILDTGVDKTHPSLSGKIVSEACYSTDDTDFEISPICPGGDATKSEEPGSGVNCTVSADCSHGTSVAGVAASVAPGAGLISIQVNSLFNNAADCEEAGATTTPCILVSPSDLDRGLDRVFELTTPEGGSYSVASVNFSQAFPILPGTCDNGNPVKLAIDQLRSIGIATVVAAGNEAGQEGQANAIGFPACTSTAVSVGATGDGVSLGANVMAPFSNGAEFLSLLAPGYYTSAPIPGGGFNNVSGTSVAAAHVSGAWAILKQQQPAAGVSAVLSRLANNGVFITDPRNNNVPKPRIQIDAALSCLQNVPANRWKGEYFSNPDLAGDPVMRRDDGTSFLDKNFGSGSPSSICGPGEDDFSVRWTRTAPLTTNVHQFTVTTDGGVRLYVGGVKKLDLWNGPPGTNTVSVLLDAENYEIILEFRKSGETAQASLSWDTPCTADVPADSWRGEYFKDNPNNPDEHLIGNPLMVRNDGNGFLDFNWGGGGPNSACLLGEDYFSARWTRSVTFSAGTWRFTATADDGVRLYVGGPNRIDKWFPQSPTTYTADMELGAGVHNIRMEYFERGGGAVASLSWAPAPPLPPSNLGAVAVSPTQINLSWTDNSNFEDGFKIERWNGSGYSQIATVGATTTIATYADSGLAYLTTYSYRVRAYNSIGDSGYSNESSATTLCGYDVSPTSATFAQNGGAGSVTVSSPAGCSWSAASNESWITITSGVSGAGNGSVNYHVADYPEWCPSHRLGTLTVAGRTVAIGQFANGSPCCFDPTSCLSEQPQPTALDQSATGVGTGGLTARYFSNTTLSGQPALKRTDAAINFNWTGARPDATLSANGFSVRWNGQLAAPSSEAYTFYLYSDGGARLWVHNQLVIDRWQPSSEPLTRSAPVELKAGAKAPIRVEYYNADGKARIHLLWNSASTPKQIIPQRQLYPETATDQPAPTDTVRQVGILLPPGSDAGPKATRPQPSEWLTVQLSRAGLALLIAGCVLALLLLINLKAVNTFSSVAPDVSSSEVTMLR